jgi:hypothetical protein
VQPELTWIGKTKLKCTTWYKKGSPAPQSIWRNPQATTYAKLTTCLDC